MNPVISVTTSYISITVERHYELNHRMKYLFCHNCKYDGKKYKVEIDYRLDGDFSATVAQERSYSDAQIYGQWSYGFSTRGFIKMEDIADKIRPVDTSVIAVVREKGGNVSDELTIKLLQIGEYMLREESWWIGYKAVKGDNVKINYGTPDHKREVIPEPQILKEAPKPQEHNEDTCMCHSCHNSRYLRKYSGGNYSRALSPSSCGGSGSDSRYRYQHDDRNAAQERHYYESGGMYSYDPYEHGGHV